MSFLKNLFSKDEPIRSSEHFWNWFREHEKSFREVVLRRGDIEGDFFDKVFPKLNQINDALFLLVGVYDENTVELIITPDGVVKNIVFAEEVVEAAPALSGWRFTALKPETSPGFNLEMNGNKFSDENIRFSPNENWEHPDEVDITIIYDAEIGNRRDEFTNGIYLFLDNFLGELVSVTTIDNLAVVGKNEFTGESRDIGELKAYLMERQSRFVEKYDGERRDTENDSYSSLEGTTQSGAPLVAVVNSSLLVWDRKASHPWIARVEIRFDGTANNGMPDNETYDTLDKIEDVITARLKDTDGYLNIGRQTLNGSREIYFACREFRKPSKVLHETQQHNPSGLEIDYVIYKDKYWQSFDRFIPEENDGYEN